MMSDKEVSAVQDFLAEPPFASNWTAPQPPYWTVPWRVALTLVLAVIMCGAVLGNSLVVVVVLRNRGMRTRTNLFLCNLAVADLLCAVIDMPFSLITVANGRWIFNDTVCKLNGFALLFLFVASIHTLMYMSIHKYLSLASPFRRSLSTRCVVAMMTCAWLWAAAAGTSTVSLLTDVVYKPATAQCGPRYPSDVASFVHFFVVVVTCYGVPMIVVAVCNSLTLAVVRGHGVRMRLHSTDEWRRIGGQQRQIAVTLLLVVVFFAVAWTPWVVYAFYVIFTDSRHVQPPAIINPIVYWCIYLNSVCNPVIYALRSEAFREGYKHVFCTGGGKGFAGDTSSLRSSSTMTRHYVDKVDGPSSAAILNNAVRVSMNAGGDSQWASLDRYGRRRRSRRTTSWATELDDDGPQNHVCYDRMATVSNEDGERALSSPDTVPASASLTSVRAVVENFDNSSTEQSPINDRGVDPLSQNTDQTSADASLDHRDNVTMPDRVKAGTVALTLSWDLRPVPAGGVGSTLAARACSEGDVLAGVEAADAATRRGSRLLSCASALLGRFVTETRQRLVTVSSSEWRRRCDVASRQQYASSNSFGDTLATSADDGRRSGTQTVAATPTDDDGGEGRSSTPREVRLFSLSGSIDTSNGRRQSQRRRVANAPSSSTAGLSADGNMMTPSPAITLDHEMLQRSRGSKKRPTVRRYPSVERLDLPRRRAAVAAAILDVGSGQSHQRSADRKRAERFRRQYVDVQLQRQSTPFDPKSMKSMPSRVDVCGTTPRDVVASPQLLRVPASADVLLS